jgi:hypothetical protein
VKRDRRPPACATWLLQHFGDGYRRDALLGDLIEEHRGGRSDAWFWRQCLMGALAGSRRGLSRRLPAFGALLGWWLLVVVLAFRLKEPVLLVAAFDPTFWWLILLKRRSRRR